MNQSTDYNFLLKIVLIGDAGVGKSAMLVRFADGCFADSYISTIGVDFKLRTICVNGKQVRFQIWDTAGQERFRTIICSYYRGAHGLMIMYDITSEDSFRHLTTWMEQITTYDLPKAAKMVVGTKQDCEKDRQVAACRGVEFAQQNNALFIETSCKHGFNVDESFIQLATQIIQTQPELDRSNPHQMKPAAENSCNTGGWCGSQ